MHVDQAPAWGKGPLPDYDLVRLQHDTRELLSWLRDRLGFGGRLLWYKPQYLSSQLGSITAAQVARNHSIRTVYDASGRADAMHHRCTRPLFEMSRRAARPWGPTPPSSSRTSNRRPPANARWRAATTTRPVVPFHVNVLLSSAMSMTDDAGARLVRGGTDLNKSESRTVAVVTPHAMTAGTGTAPYRAPAAALRASRRLVGGGR
jgi:hypothetical protein